MKKFWDFEIVEIILIIIVLKFLKCIIKYFVKIIVDFKFIIIKLNVGVKFNLIVIIYKWFLKLYKVFS